MQQRWDITMWKPIAAVKPHMVIWVGRAGRLSWQTCQTVTTVKRLKTVTTTNQLGNDELNTQNKTNSKNCQIPKPFDSFCLDLNSTVINASRKATKPLTVVTVDLAVMTDLSTRALSKPHSYQMRLDRGRRSWGFFVSAPVTLTGVVCLQLVLTLSVTLPELLTGLQGALS